MNAAVIALALGLVGFAAALIFAARLVRHAHLERVGAEKVRGHLRLRRRMQGLAGRRTNRPEFTTVVRAETMYGWVWIITARHHGHPFTEVMGWSPFERTARRAMARRQRREDS